MDIPKRVKSAIGVTIAAGALFLGVHFGAHAISERLNPSPPTPAGLMPMGAGPGGAIVPLGATPGVVTMTRSSPAPREYVSLKGPIVPNTVPQTWVAAGNIDPRPCPKAGDKSWHTVLSTSAPTIVFDCPVGVASKMIAGKEVRVNIARTRMLHPGGPATYELVAPR